ncbi:MAG: acylphosphatase [Bacteroidetes bacterium]|jgi:acylphosphatase|nr:acylphosphatase [Bacteroidota bacterium]
MAERIHVVVTGLVQGVGFRYFVQARAIKHEVGGWVRNNDDGSVEVLAEGEAEDLDAFLDALRVGPRAAQVSDLRIDRTLIANPVRGFDIR